MAHNVIDVPSAELERQKEIMKRMAEYTAALPEAPLAIVNTYGCQHNEADR